MYYVWHGFYYVMFCSVRLSPPICYFIRLGYITLWFVIWYCIIVYYIIVYLFSVLHIIFYALEVISRSPERTSLRIIYNMIQSWGWSVISQTFDLLWKLIYNNSNFCPPEGLAHFEKQCHLLLHSSPFSVHVHFLTMSNFNVRVSRDSHDENPE